MLSPEAGTPGSGVAGVSDSRLPPGVRGPLGWWEPTEERIAPTPPVQDSLTKSRVTEPRVGVGARQDALHLIHCSHPRGFSTSTGEPAGSSDRMPAGETRPRPVSMGGHRGSAQGTRGYPNKPSWTDIDGGVTGLLAHSRWVATEPSPRKGLNL